MELLKKLSIRNKIQVFFDLYIKKNQIEPLAKHNQLLLDSVCEGIVGLDASGSISFINPSVTELIGWQQNELIGKPATILFHPDKIRQDYIDWQRVDIHEGCEIPEPYKDNDACFITKNQKLLPVRFSCNPILANDNKLQGYVLTFNDIAEQKQAQEELTKLAEYDLLTGLANRALLYRLLPAAIEKARLKHAELVLLFLDLDRFKGLNGALGRNAGDILLKQVADRLVSAVRKSDTVVRLDGDEFTVMLEGSLTSRQMIMIADKIIHSISQPFNLDNYEVYTSTSIGIATYPHCANNAQSLIKCASAAMYAAKSKGRNNYQFYTQEFNEQIEERIKIENCLCNALENNEFEIHYQPRLDMKNNTINGFEALLRWHSPSLGKIPPSVFIPIAEETRIINDIGLWVLQESCKQKKDWLDQGLSHPSIKLAINLSTKQLNNKELISSIKHVLNETGLQSDAIELELTESAIMDNPGENISILKMINDLGITIAIDDFGTGYSSLNYLKLLPIKLLKIDKSFVHDIFLDPNDAVIAKSIIRLSHSLGLSVIAEGVETKAQYDFLRQNSCDQMQGYYYSKPLTKHEMANYLSDSKIH